MFYETFRRAHNIQLLMPSKFFGHFSNLYSALNTRPTPPSKQCWFTRKVHMGMKNIQLQNIAKCLRNRVTFLCFERMCVNGLTI